MYNIPAPRPQLFYLRAIRFCMSDPQFSLVCTQTLPRSADYVTAPGPIANALGLARSGDTVIVNAGNYTSETSTTIYFNVTITYARACIWQCTSVASLYVAGVPDLAEEDRSRSRVFVAWCAGLWERSSSIPRERLASGWSSALLASRSN
jgi:hypothetical protein